MCELFSGLRPESCEPVSRSLRLNGQSTSIRLERIYWETLDRMASAEGRSTASFISALHARVLEEHGEVSNFTSLLRCVCVSRFPPLQPPVMAAE